MGLRSFRGDRPHLRDTEIAKNYLDEPELRAMGQIVSGYLDFAERQAEREIPMTMRDWAAHLDGILTATGEKLLESAGGVSRAQAHRKSAFRVSKVSTAHIECCGARLSERDTFPRCCNGTNADRLNDQIAAASLIIAEYTFGSSSPTAS